MLNEDGPVVRLQDWEIEGLLAERKKITLDMLQTQNRHLMGIKHNIRPLYALLSASL